MRFSDVPVKFLITGLGLLAGFLMIFLSPFDNTVQITLIFQVEKSMDKFVPYFNGIIYLKSLTNHTCYQMS